MSEPEVEVFFRFSLVSRRKLTHFNDKITRGMPAIEGGIFRTL